MHLDLLQKAKNYLNMSFKSQQNDKTYAIRGDVFLTSRNGKTGEVEFSWEKRNLIVNDASILIARLMKDRSEPPFGSFALTVGSGNVGWDLQAPPPATATQRSLYAEIGRKRFATTSFVNGAGNHVAYPTNVVDFQTIFAEAEAVGPWVEMGLIGGNVSTNLSIRNPVSPPNGAYDPTVDLTTRETLINYLTFPVLNKPATSTFELVWRLTF